MANQRIQKDDRKTAQEKRLHEALAKKPSNISLTHPPIAARYGRKSMARLIKNRPQNSPGPQVVTVPRPASTYLQNIVKKTTRLPLPQAGAFNAGLAPAPNDDGYIMVYRPDEYSFTGCFLNKDLTIRENSYFPFSITNCADPRILWTPDGKLLMVYSSTEEMGFFRECIRGAVIMDLQKSPSFLDNAPFRVSPSELKARQKNWMPFIYENSIYLVASVCPHEIYELKLGERITCEKRFETQWINPWFYKDFLRGNANIVRLESGQYLGTFHTAITHDTRHYYDNGCYLFEGEPPFRVLKCSNKTYLPAESATEAHFRKHHEILVNFPVGMVRNGNELLISYGSNDSAVYVLETTVDEMLDLTLEVY